jgi:hypothetical protein
MHSRSTCTSVNCAIVCLAAAMGSRQKNGAAGSAEEIEREEQFIHELAGALLNPKFQQAMTAMQPAWSRREEPSELPPDAFTCQLEHALEVLEAPGNISGSAAADIRPAADGEDAGGQNMTLEALVAQLGFDEVTEEQRAAIAAAPEVIASLVGELEVAVDRERRRLSSKGDAGAAREEEGVGCLQQ